MVTRERLMAGYWGKRFRPVVIFTVNIEISRFNYKELFVNKVIIFRRVFVEVLGMKNRTYTDVRKVFHDDAIRQKDKEMVKLFADSS